MNRWNHHDGQCNETKMYLFVISISKHWRPFLHSIYGISSSRKNYYFVSYFVRLRALLWFIIINIILLWLWNGCNMNFKPKYYISLFQIHPSIKYIFNDEHEHSSRSSPCAHGNDNGNKVIKIVIMIVLEW